MAIEKKLKSFEDAEKLGQLDTWFDANIEISARPAEDLANRVGDTLYGVVCEFEVRVCGEDKFLARINGDSVFLRREGSPIPESFIIEGYPDYPYASVYNILALDAVLQLSSGITYVIHGGIRAGIKTMLAACLSPCHAEAGVMEPAVQRAICIANALAAAILRGIPMEMTAEYGRMLARLEAAISAPTKIIT